MRKPKQERKKDIKAKKAFNKQFSKLNELERLKYLGLDPRDAFKITRSAEPNKVEKKIIDATKFYSNIPEDFFDPSRCDIGWLRNKLIPVIGESDANEFIQAIHNHDVESANRIQDKYGDVIYDLANEYQCYRIAFDSIKEESNEDVSITNEMREQIIANFAYIYNSMMEPNHYSHNGTVLENIFAPTIYDNRNENDEIQVNLNELMAAEVHNNGVVMGRISKMNILKFIQTNDKLFVSQKNDIDKAMDEHEKTLKELS